MFTPSDIDTFRIVSWSLDHETGEASLVYAFDDSHEFVETIKLPPSRNLEASRKAALERTIALLHVFAGVSYYKAAAPSRIAIETMGLDAPTLELVSLLYGEGLGEFAFKNGVPIPRPSITTSGDVAAGAPSAGLDERALVAVGGGKDSCVSIETLRDSDAPLLLASVNRWPAIVDVIEAAELPSIHAERSLSPHLFELNEMGALNGHVPVTAVVSLVLTALAIIGNCNTVVMSNERSASTGNLFHDGVFVNHQFSKSFDVERRIAALLRSNIDADLSYFSLLRPLSELDIARRFATTTRYDSVFTSCNRAFKIHHENRLLSWCRDCPKCRFVFLALAPFAPRQRLEGIFGGNVLDDESQVDGFDELIGWHADKPFECVGEIEESIAAFLLLRDSPEWTSTHVVRRFFDDVLPKLLLPDDITTRPFVPSHEHIVPAQFSKALDAAQ